MMMKWMNEWMKHIKYQVKRWTWTSTNEIQCIQSTAGQIMFWVSLVWYEQRQQQQQQCKLELNYTKYTKNLSVITTIKSLEIRVCTLQVANPFVYLKCKLTISIKHIESS